MELTTKCNFACKHCFIEEHTNIGLTTEEIFDVLRKLREFGVYELQFTGGEIFIRKDIIEIIRFARRNLNFRILLLTNVSLLDDKLIKELADLYVEKISTTLFSLSDEINDKITNVNGSATLVKRNIQKIAKTGIKTEIKTVVMKENVDEVSSIRQFCRENGIEFIATEGLFPSITGKKAVRNLAMSDSQLCKNIKCLDEIRFSKLYVKEKTLKQPICCELHYSLFINSFGDVYPCNLWFHKIGNMKTDVLSKLWNDEFLYKIRNTTWSSLKKCASCENSKYCIRCTGIVEALTGDYLASDPYACRTSMARKKIAEANI